MEKGLTEIWRKFNDTIIDLALNGSSPEVDLDNAIRKNSPRGVAKSIDNGATQMSLKELIRDNIRCSEDPKDPKRVEILEVLLSKKDSLENSKKEFESGAALETALFGGNLAHFKIIEQAMLDEGIKAAGIKQGLKQCAQLDRKDLLKAGIESPYFDKSWATELLHHCLLSGDKDNSKLLVKKGGDPTFDKSHLTLSSLKNEFEEKPTKENQSRLDLTLSLYSQKDKRALLDDPKWTGIIHTLCKSMLEEPRQKSKNQKDEEMSMGYY